MMEFLYFPDNKLEYLPSIAFLIITLVAAMYTMMFILKLAKKQERKAKELEKKVLSQLRAQQDSRLESQEKEAQEQEAKPDSSLYPQADSSKSSL